MSRYYFEKMLEGHDLSNVRFMVPMQPLRTVMGISYTSSNDEYVITECYVDEHRYKVEDGHKITLRPLDPNYASQDFYQMDLGILMARNPDRYWMTFTMTDTH